MSEIFPQVSSVDGNSFSGKTTLVHGLHNTYKYTVIEEYDAYAGGGANFPSFPPENYYEAKKSVRFFSELERQRTQDALSASTTGSVIMDRSFLSCVAFQYIVAKNHPNIPNAYLYSLDLLHDLAEKGDILIPPVLLYLHPENQTSIESRITVRGLVAIGFLNQMETFSAMFEWFSQLISKGYGPHNSAIITSLQNKPDGVVRIANDFLMQADYSQKIEL
jgi:deoxyadenosine/deoxycytidine kinase